MVQLTHNCNLIGSANIPALCTKSSIAKFKHFLFWSGPQTRLVERQHVNYYVRKLAAQGLVSSKMSTSRATIEPMMPISLDEPDGGVAEEVSAHETWCAAWRFAAELVHVLRM